MTRSIFFCTLPMEGVWSVFGPLFLCLAGQKCISVRPNTDQWRVFGQYLVPLHRYFVAGNEK